MDLICPTCQKRLSLEDKFAGMVVRCPMCEGMFQAPALPSVAGAVVPPVPAPSAEPPSPGAAPASAPTVTPGATETFALQPAPAAAAPDAIRAVPLPPSSEPAPFPEPIEPPPGPPGDYTKTRTLRIRGEILSWFPPVCVTLLFVLSLFPWYWTENVSYNLWQLAFSAIDGTYTFYTVVLIFVAWPLAIITFIVEQRWLSLPAALRPLWPWRSAFVGAALLLPLVFFFFDYVACQFRPLGNPATLAMKLALRVHVLAVIACGLQFWLESRKPANLPPPKIELRW
jgi:hypothetical protein